MDQFRDRVRGESSITRIDRAGFKYDRTLKLTSQTQTEIGFAAVRTRATTNERALAFPLAIQRFAPALRRAVGRCQTDMDSVQFFDHLAG
jgi:hypothetical protein